MTPAKMNTSNVILIGRSSNRHLGRALRAIAFVAVIAFVMRLVVGSIRR